MTICHYSDLCGALSWPTTQIHPIVTDNNCFAAATVAAFAAAATTTAHQAV